MAGMVNCRVDIPAELVTLYCLAFSPASPFPLNPKLSRVLLLLPPGAWLLQRWQSLDWLLDWGEYRLFEVWAGVGAAGLFPLKGKTSYLWDLPVQGRSFNLTTKAGVSSVEQTKWHTHTQEEFTFCWLSEVHGRATKGRPVSETTSATTPHGGTWRPPVSRAGSSTPTSQEVIIFESWRWKTVNLKSIFGNVFNLDLSGWLGNLARHRCQSKVMHWESLSADRLFHRALAPSGGAVGVPFETKYIVPSLESVYPLRGLMECWRVGQVSLKYEPWLQLQFVNISSWLERQHYKYSEYFHSQIITLATTLAWNLQEQSKRENSWGSEIHLQSRVKPQGCLAVP